MDNFKSFHNILKNNNKKDLVFYKIHYDNEANTHGILCLNSKKFDLKFLQALYMTFDEIIQLFLKIHKKHKHIYNEF